MKFSKLVRWHIAGWAFMSIFFLMPFFIYGFTNRLLYGSIAFLMDIGAFYINLLVILPRWVRQRKIYVLFLGWAALILAATLITICLNHLLVANTIKEKTLMLEAITALFRNTLIIGIFIASSVGYRSIYDWFSNERIKRNMETLQLKTELSFLRSQINPHFLFNTLNNIYTLAFQQSDKTADAIAMLSGMMRYLLYDSRDEYVPFKTEIKCIEDLLELQALRVKGNMALIYGITGPHDESLIAPLLLLPFVENLFKHGDLTNSEDRAILDIGLTDGIVTLYCKNKIGHHLKDDTKGIGIPNVRRRLELLYPGQFTLEQASDETHFSVNLIIRIK